MTNVPHDPILVVDDDPTFCEIMTDMLGSAGYRVESETDPVTALEQTRRRHFSLVVSDVSMPRLLGTTLATQIRRTHPQLPVLLVSAFPDAATRAHARALGIPVLAKPFKPEMMLALVRRLLRASGDGDAAQ